MEDQQALPPVVVDIIAKVSGPTDDVRGHR